MKYYELYTDIVNIFRDFEREGCLVNRITVGNGLLQPSWFSDLIKKVGGEDYVAIRKVLI